MTIWQQLPSESGIYQITDGKVSYVGLAKNIRRRVKQHVNQRGSRSRIVLDRPRAKAIVLELLPRADDRTLALREWYWFHILKERGQIMVNDPNSLGKTKSGQYLPDRSVPLKTPVAFDLLAFRRPMTIALGIAIASFTVGFCAVQSRWGEKFLIEVPEAVSILPPQPVIVALNACTIPLRVGDRGEAVANLQRYLTYFEYYRGNLEGNFDLETQEAVKAFQRDSGLAIDGVVGCQTQEAIEEVLANR